eukprot:4426428-Pleurochrysis_carterae.AAC.1
MSARFRGSERGGGRPALRLGCAGGRVYRRWNGIPRGGCAAVVEIASSSSSKSSKASSPIAC